MFNSTHHIILYQTHACAYSARIRAQLDSKNINYETRDILANDAFKEELYNAVKLSTSPCLRIDTDKGSQWITTPHEISIHIDTELNTPQPA